MANVPIPSLPIAINLNGEEEFELVQPPGATGTSKRGTLRQIAALANPAASLTAQSVFANPTDLPALGTSVVGSAGGVFLYDGSGNLGFGSVPTGSISGVLSLDHGGLGTSTLGALGQALISSGVIIWSNTNTEETYLSNYSSQTTTIYRSNQQRWSDTIYAMDYGLDPTGSTANLDTALNKAIGEAKARGRGEIRLPPGSMRLSDTVRFTNDASTPLRIIGCGAGVVGSNNNQGVTDVGAAFGASNWFELGQDNVSGTYSDNITFEEIQFRPSQVMTGGVVFYTYLLRNSMFRHCIFNAVNGAATLGANATTNNNSIYLTFEDCGGNPNGSNPMFNLGSSGVLKFHGTERWNGNGLAVLFSQSGTQNCDGFYCNQYAEQFLKYVDVTGSGISNLEWTGYQIDRFSVAFDTGNITTGGVCYNWNLHDFQMLNNGTTSCYGIIWAKTVGSNYLIGMSASNIYMYGINNNCVLQTGTGTYGDYNGLRMENCGSAGVPLISFTGRGTVNNSHAWKRPGSTSAPYTYGVDWIGTSEPAYRFQSGNGFSDFGTAAQNGTA